MALRTAPCPRCSAVIVFGERKCRTCAMDFDYGPNPPPEPSQAAVLDALLGGDATPTQSVPKPKQAQTQPQKTPAAAAPPPSPPAAPLMEGLDTGRFSAAGDVEIEDIPGFIDSSLFKSMTPDQVETTAIPGFEQTLRDDVQVRTQKAPEIETARVDVGDVQPAAAVPGLYGSDMFKTDVDVGAGGEASDLLDVSHTRVKPQQQQAQKKKKKLSDADLPRIVCNNCGSGHNKPRCPSCATAHPQAEH